MEKIWETTAGVNENSVSELMMKNSIPKAVAMYMAARGLTADKVDSYLNVNLSELSDPFRFPGIQAAVERLWKAIQAREIILIHGDYDTDGITSTALLSWVLSKNGADVRSFLPHRFDDGYGFTPDTLLKAVESFDSRCKVLVTVDCGINSVDAVKEAQRQGIDVIITDHHEPGDQVPEALAIINPKIYSEMGDLHLLSGVGVSFKLSHAFVKYGREHNLGGFTTDLQEVLDFVALGTIADIVPLMGENRILVKHGMKILKKQIRPGIRALIEIAKIKTQLKPSDITFKLAPRINAAGRLGNANTALALLNSDNIVDAYRYAEILEDFNLKRQIKEQEIFNEAKQQIDTMLDLTKSKAIVVAGEGWHQGVIGIVASRLARDYNKPAIVLTIQGEEAHGSGRSVGNLNLVQVLSSCSGLLTRYGGHPMAVGLGMTKEMISKFHEEFEKQVSVHIKEADLVNQVNYDGIVELRDLSEDFFSYLDRLEPFGHCNPPPVFRINRLEIVKIFPLNNGHCRGVFRDRSGECSDFIAFNRTMLALHSTWDIIASPQINDYYGDRKQQLQVIDMLPPG